MASTYVLLSVYKQEERRVWYILYVYVEILSLYIFVTFYQKYCQGLEGLEEWIFIFLSSAGSCHVHYMWDNSTCYTEIYFFIFVYEEWVRIYEGQFNAFAKR